MEGEQRVLFIRNKKMKKTNTLSLLLKEGVMQLTADVPKRPLTEPLGA